MYFWWENKLVQTLRKTIWRILKKLKIDYHIIEEFQFWMFLQRKQKLKFSTLFRIAKVVCVYIYIYIYIYTYV